MFTQVENSFKEKLAATTSWPIRWRNENWLWMIKLSDGDMPLDSIGAPMPCIEADIVLMEDSSCIGVAGNGTLQSRAEGWVYFHLSVAKGSGTATINSQIDLLWTTFKRRELTVSGLTTQKLTVMDPKIDDDVMDYVEGNRFSRTISFPWTLDYVV